MVNSAFLPSRVKASFHISKNVDAPSWIEQPYEQVPRLNINASLTCLYVSSSIVLSRTYPDGKSIFHSSAESMSF